MHSRLVCWNLEMVKNISSNVTFIVPDKARVENFFQAKISFHYKLHGHRARYNEGPMSCNCSLKTQRSTVTIRLFVFI
jgi:hypothetical protein